MFASLNSCRGFNKSRRDDVESLFYLIIYLLNGNQLPWVKKDQNNHQTLSQLLKFRLMLQQTQTLIKMTPLELQPSLKQVLLYEFNETPKYESLRKVFTNMLN
jgi:casein kinase 1